MTRTLFVPGKPAPQGSKRHVGNGRMIESSREVGPWRERVALAAHGHARGLLAPPVSVRVEFIMPRPKSTPKRSTPAATKQPDIDKLARAILDSLTGVWITNDSHVTDLYAHKRLANVDETPGAWIQVIGGSQ